MLFLEQNDHSNTLHRATLCQLWQERIMAQVQTRRNQELSIAGLYPLHHYRLGSCNVSTNQREPMWHTSQAVVGQQMEAVTLRSHSCESIVLAH